MEGKTAIIGNGDCVLAFKAAGVDTFVADTAEKARDILRKAARKYKVIFLTDDLAKDLDDLIKRMLEEAYPVIVPIPSQNGSNGYAMNKLREETERALGVDILFQREDK